MIELNDIQTITDHCIQLLSCAESLRRDELTKEVHVLTEKMFPYLRKLFIAMMMHNKQLICVSGLQGAGKTTLMKNFYGIDKDLLNVSIGRGERIPILITEGNVAEPHVIAIRIDNDQNGTYSKTEVVLQKDEIINATKGEDERIMYMEITVPYKHTYNSGVSFMLLPGFEKKNEYWNDLIEFSVNSSDAAVFVFNESSFSHAENENYLDRIEKKFGSNVVYVISGSDESLDDNAEVKNSCMNVLQVKESDRVVCVGQYSDVEKNNAWIAAFKTAIDNYALKETQVSQKTSSYIYGELIKIQDLLYTILDYLNSGDSFETKDYHNHALLKNYDAAIAKKRQELDRNLSDEFVIAKDKSVKKMAEQFDEKPWLKSVKRTLFGTNVKEEYIETQEIIKKSLYNNGVCLPDFHKGIAFKHLIRTIDTPSENAPNAFQLLIDTKETEDGNTILLETQDTKDALNDVCALVQIPNKNAERYKLQNPNHNRILQAVAEMTAYYYGLTSYDKLAEQTSALISYVPAESRLKGKDLLQGVDASKKFAIGLAGVMGVDILRDGSLDLISNIAMSCGFSMPIAAAATVVIVGIGATISIMRDVNNMQRSDFASAKMAVAGLYDNIHREALARFDVFAEAVRDRIEDNLADLGGDRKVLVANYNAKVEVNNLLDLIKNMTDKYRQDSHDVGTYFSR